MYDVDDKDHVNELEGMPQSSVGAPLPFVVSDEYQLVLAYLMQETPVGWDGTSVRIVGPTSDGEPIALVKFEPCYAYMFGPPNDEAFDGHPLAKRGLHPYGAFEIKHSSWIRRLERMNSVHPSHRPERFWEMRHLVFAFHDSTLECMCDRLEITLAHGSIQSMVPEMVRLLGWGRR
jgi:hypothetical protein